jgi:hypothetical protein
LRARAAGLGGGPADSDIAVIVARHREAETLLCILAPALMGDGAGRAAGMAAGMEADVHPPARADARRLRHDLMNALGAIDNYAELIAEDVADLAMDAEAVRAAVRGLVTVARQVRPAP